jgi:WNK lysine deficient protein kinase
MLITLEEIKRVTDEIELLKKLSHPHIISLKHSWEDKKKNQIVLITDIVTGGTINQ